MRCFRRAATIKLITALTPACRRRDAKFLIVIGREPNRHRQAGDPRLPLLVIGGPATCPASDVQVGRVVVDVVHAPRPCLREMA